MKKDLVIIINGGGTNGAELKSLYKHLNENEKYFVYYPGFLPGGFVGGYFPKSTTVDFIRFIDETIEMINEDFNKVYLIGYSLGACTTAIIAARSEKINKVVLIAPIIKNPKYSKFLRGLGKSLAYAKNLTRIQKIFYKEFISRFSKVPKIHILHLELYLHYTKRYLKMITQPTLIVETLQDEMVKKKSIDFLVKQIKNDTVVRYPVDTSHFLFFDKNIRKDVMYRIAEFLEEE
jgi:carboxylesterase